jgi:hypothetical protein
MVKKKGVHYVDNKKFYAEMLKYKTKCDEATYQGMELPRPSDYIGSCIMKIAYKLSNKPNFINYPFKEDMIADGIENCITYIKNFDPEKSNNPFAYFTQIIYFAFLRRIEKEKKVLYTKYKSTELFNIQNALSAEDGEYIKSSEGATENASIFIREFEEKRFSK